MACANFDDSVTTENELDLITNDLENGIMRFLLLCVNILSSML